MTLPEGGIHLRTDREKMNEGARHFASLMPHIKTICVTAGIEIRGTFLLTGKIKVAGDLTLLEQTRHNLIGAGLLLEPLSSAQ